MAGLDDLNKHLHPKCPECHKTLDLREYWKFLFSSILARLVHGERVKVSGFGSFEARPFGGWMIKGLNGQPKEVPKQKVIRFYASKKAKNQINSVT